MGKSGLDKQRAVNLLENLFPGFSVVAKKSSNNGDPFFVYNGKDKYFIKVLNSESLEKEGLDEVAALKKVKSQHVVELLDSGTLYDSYLYLKFPFIEGSTVDKIPSSEFDDNEIRKLLHDVGLGIRDLANARVVHRDVKPQNIIRDTNGNYLLLDLGIGYVIGEDDRDTAKERGSRKYSSPEQFLSAENEDIDISFASDLFSLGLIAYQCATEEYPFEKLDKQKYSSVGAAICKMPLPPLSSVSNKVSEAIATLIDRMLAKNQSNRFATPAQYLDLLNGRVLEKKRNLKVYIYNPAPFAAFKEYYENAKDNEKADGVLVKIIATDEHIEQFRELGLSVLVDPLTYQLPYRDRVNLPQVLLRKTFGIKPETDLTGLKINDDSFLKKITRKAVDRQKALDKIILPYFALRSENDELINVTKKVWRFHKDYTHDLEAEIYGGLIVPESVLTNSKKRARLLDRFMNGGDVDGMYITFQNEDDSVYISNDETKLTAIKEIINHFALQGKLIIGKCDPAMLHLIDEGIVVTSGNKSERYLSYARLDTPKKQEGSIKQENIALRYFCGQLYDFIEEKPTLEAMRRFGLEAKVRCDCAYCKQADIFNTATAVSKVMHTLMRSHYCTQICAYVQSTNGQDAASYRKQAVIKLENAALLSDEIAKSYPGSKGLPNHEGLIGAINKG